MLQNEADEPDVSDYEDNQQRGEFGDKNEQQREVNNELLDPVKAHLHQAGVNLVHHGYTSKPYATPLQP
jgi:hypothetical protein